MRASFVRIPDIVMDTAASPRYTMRSNSGVASPRALGGLYAAASPREAYLQYVRATQIRATQAMAPGGVFYKA